MNYQSEYLETDNYNARASAATRDLIEWSLRVCRHMFSRGRYEGDEYNVIDCVTLAVFCYFHEIADGESPVGVILREADTDSLPREQENSPAPAGSGSSEGEKLDGELALAITRLYRAYRDKHADYGKRESENILDTVADCTSRMLGETLTSLLAREQCEVQRVTELHSSHA